MITGIREYLLESEDRRCPSCQETDISPDNLITNKFLRQAVTNFKNETGYTKMTKDDMKKYREEHEQQQQQIQQQQMKIEQQQKQLEQQQRQQQQQHWKHRPFQNQQTKPFHHIPNTSTVNKQQTHAPRIPHHQRAALVSIQVHGHGQDQGYINNVTSLIVDWS